jgi:hypothetical protein
MISRRKLGPTWGLLHPSSILDGEEAPYLLGRIVADVDDLLGEYFPYDPRQVIKYLLNLVPMEVASNGIENLLAITKSKDANIRLTQILGISLTNYCYSVNNILAVF